VTVQELIACRRQQTARSTAQFLFGATIMMERLREDVVAAARSDANVLIVGEPGVGKEAVARHIHAASRRRPAPFVTIGCAGLPAPLLESELFGHTRGSFAGAYRDKPGLAARADGGVLFLEEIGELTPRLQTLLLRVIETGELPQSGTHEVNPRVNVRVITAASRSLADAMAAGAFRDDLYYRLNVIRLTIAPLREREGDIVDLLRHHLHERAKAHGVDAPRLSAAAEAILAAYRWPGNVRELTNVVERLVVRRDGAARHEVVPDDLPPEILETSAFTSD
jgi:transcriptional regulator with PAS, ATPase and Fis domain